MHLAAALVIVEGVLADLLRAAIPVVGRVDGGRRTDRIHQRDAEQSGRGRGPPQDRGVHVRQRPLHLGDAVAVDLEVAGDLEIRLRVDQADRSWKVAEERDVRHDGEQIGHEARDRDREPPALARACHGDASGVDGRVGADGIDGAHRVGDKAPVVVGLRRQDPVGHDTVDLGVAAPVPVGGAARAPLGTLSPRVHDQEGVPGGRPQEVPVREAAPAAVPHELDHRRDWSCCAGRQAQPGADRIPAETCERDVIRIDEREARGDAREGRREIVAPRVRERRRPERGEIRRRFERGLVRPELIEGEVEVWHEAVLGPLRNGWQLQRCDQADPPAVTSAPAGKTIRRSRVTAFASSPGPSTTNPPVAYPPASSIRATVGSCSSSSTRRGSAQRLGSTTVMPETVAGWLIAMSAAGASSNPMTRPTSRPTSSLPAAMNASISG